MTIVAKRTAKAIAAGFAIIVNEGGARSSKTYSEIQLMIHAASNRPKLRCSIVSHSLPHIKRGAFRDFNEIMVDWGLWRDEEFSFSDFIYYFPNGSYIELFGLEDEGKARGPGRDWLLINEANLIKKTLYQQLGARTTELIMLDLNPAELDSWCYEVADDPRNKKIHSTYKDNPNLGAVQIRFIEAYKDGDPMMWDVYGLGLRGKSTVTIYTHWKVCLELPMKGEVWYGQDFGYVVPSALVRVELYEGALYVEELIYQEKLTTNDLIAKYGEIGMTRTGEIYCDSAEPKTIEEMSRAPYNVFEADKDVWAGIQKVKSMPLYITEKSVNLLKEIKNYKWKTDKEGEVLATEEPVKKDDHLMDAMRYAIFTKLSQAGYTWTAF